jgi:fatty acid desaturase
MLPSGEHAHALNVRIETPVSTHVTQSPLREDPRLRAVQWQDLANLTAGQKIHEVLLSVPWLGAAIALFRAGWIAPGLLAAFFFFLTGLRQAHGAQHYILGIGRRAQDWILVILSVLMISSLHALQATHMYHHRHVLEPTDVESSTARLRWWNALLVGPWFIVRSHLAGFHLAKPRQRVWIWIEATAVTCWVTSITLWGPQSLQWFVAAMVVGECLTGFFAVWTVHHDCDPDWQFARTQRGAWKNLVSCEMFYHLEHHLFPAVPTRRLPELAERIDKLAPQLSKEQVF